MAPYNDDYQAGPPQPPQQQRQDAPMTKLCGLWRATSKDGSTSYLSGSLGAARVLIFKNKYKEAENHPDYNVFIVPATPKPKQPGDSGGTGGGGPRGASGAPPPDDIPF
jgi:hypothetical protein